MKQCELSKEMKGKGLEEGPWEVGVELAAMEQLRHEKQTCSNVSFSNYTRTLETVLTPALV